MPEQTATEGSTTVLWVKEPPAEGFWVADKLYRGARPGDVQEVPDGVAQVLTEAGYAERTDDRERRLEAELEELRRAETQAEDTGQPLGGAGDRKASPPVDTNPSVER
jgi:hypothetical protein